MKNFIRKFFPPWRMPYKMRFPYSCVALLIAMVLFCSIFTRCGYTNPSDNHEAVYGHSQPYTQPIQPSSTNGALDAVNEMTQNEDAPDFSSRGQSNELSEKLNNFVSFILKILCVVTLAEIVRFLNHLRKYMVRQQERQEKRLQQRRERDFAARARPDLFDFDSEFCDTLPTCTIQRSPPEHCSMSDENLAEDDPFHSDLYTAEENILAPVVSECERPDTTVLFDLQDPDKALKIMNGTEKGCIYLKETADGCLVGARAESGLHRVSPRTLDMPERNLRYSAISACFIISWEVEGGKTLRICVDNEALLEKANEESYQVVEKGRLTVIDVIE